MEKRVEDLISVVYDMLDEIDIYKHQIETLHYDNSFREFCFSNGQKNYDKILRALQSLNISDPELSLTKSMDLEEFKEYFVTILRIILGEKYEDDIRIAETFITPKRYYNNVDVATEVRDIGGILTPTKFIVSDNLNHFQLAHVINSEINVLLKPLYQNFAKTIGNLNYKRLPGILATYIAIYELSKLIKSETLVSEYEDLYIYNDSDYAKNKGKEIIPALPKYRQKDAYEHNEHNKFSFLISDIYSTSLIEAYLQDNIQFLKKYREMIAGKTSIPEYLDFYGLDLKNKDVARKYLNKVEEVQLRAKK